MIRSISFFLLCSLLSVSAQGVLSDYLEPEKALKGDVVIVQPPEEINAYLQKVDAASRQDPEWFVEHSKKARPGVPLPYDPKLGLTEEEYGEYIKLWDKRKFESLAKVQVKLQPADNGKWQVAVTGPGMPIRLMLYDPKADTWKSTNGELKRISDINADPQSILRGWTGKEWKFEKEDSFVRAKENFAIGRAKTGKYGLLVYRYQEITPEGRRLLDTSLVVRFAPVKAAKKAKKKK